MKHLRSEQGSLPLVVLVAIVVGGLVAVLFADVRMGQQTARADRDYNKAVQVADAGIQAAYSRLADVDPDDPDLPGVGGTYSCTSGDDPAGVCDGDLDGDGFEWEATRVGHERWEVRSLGSSGGSTRVIEATIGTRAIFPMAAFGDILVKLVGNNSVTSYDGEGGTSYIGAVGSNHEIELHGNTVADWIVRYGSAIFNGKEQNYTQGVETITEDAEVPNLAEEAYAPEGVCHGQDHGHYDGDQPLVGGTTYCFSSVNFPRGERYELVDADADNPVKIYIAASGDFTVQSTGASNNKTYVNMVPDPYPLSAALQVYVNHGAVEFGNHAEVAAAIYAPASVCKGVSSNAQADVYGSLICREILTQGGWDFHYDERLADVTDNRFVVNNWREESEGSTSFGVND
jgi:hypothetical protein